MTDYIQVITTVDDPKSAEKIAEFVVEKKLAACVQITRCDSIYRWQGTIEKAKEFICVMKTSIHLYPELEEEIQKIHPYDVPEILASPVLYGSKAYLDWMAGELKST